MSFILGSLQLWLRKILESANCQAIEYKIAFIPILFVLIFTYWICTLTCGNQLLFENGVITICAFIHQAVSSIWAKDVQLVFTQKSNCIPIYVFQSGLSHVYHYIRNFQKWLAYHYSLMRINFRTPSKLRHPFTTTHSRTLCSGRMEC